MNIWWLTKYKSGVKMFNRSLHSALILGTNLVLGPPEKFYRRNPSGTFRDVHWYHLYERPAIDDKDFHS